ncbi:MAG: TRAP transporter small permease [Flavobacteriaceae bacterium]
MKRLTKILALAGTLAFLVAVALTVADIVLRSLGEYTVHGLTDIVTLCTMIGALLAIPYGFAHDEHVSIDVFANMMPGALQKACALLGALLGAAFLSAIFWFAGNQMITEYGYGDRSQSIGIPMIAYWMPLVAGVGIAALVNYWLILRLIAGRKDRAPE